MRIVYKTAKEMTCSERKDKDKKNRIMGESKCFEKCAL
jgi:hypothetical protein